MRWRIRFNVSAQVLSKDPVSLFEVIHALSHDSWDRLAFQALLSSDTVAIH